MKRKTPESGNSGVQGTAKFTGASSMKNDNNTNDNGSSRLSQIETKVEDILKSVNKVLLHSNKVMESLSETNAKVDENKKDITFLSEAVSSLAEASQKREDASSKREHEQNAKLDNLIKAMEKEREKSAQLEEKVKSQDESISKLTDAISLLIQNAEQNQTAIASVSESLSGLIEATNQGQSVAKTMAENIEHIGNGLNVLHVAQVAIENRVGVIDEQVALAVDVMDRMAVRIDHAANRLERLDHAVDSGFQNQVDLAIEIAERQYHTISAPLQKLRKVAPALNQEVDNIRNAVIQFQNTNTAINKANLKNYKQLEVVANGLNNRIEDALQFGVASITPTIQSKVADLLDPMLSGAMVHIEKVKAEIDRVGENIRNLDFSSVESLEEQINGVRMVCEDTIAALGEQQSIAIEFSKQHMAQTEEVAIENEKLISKLNSLNKSSEHNLKLISAIQSDYVSIVNITETLSTTINQLLAESNGDSKKFIISALENLKNDLKSHIEETLDESTIKGVVKLLGDSQDDQEQ